MKPLTRWRLLRVSLPFTSLPCQGACHNQSILSVMTWGSIIDSCRRLTCYVTVNPLKHQDKAPVWHCAASKDRNVTEACWYLWCAYLNELCKLSKYQNVKERTSHGITAYFPWETLFKYWWWFSNKLRKLSEKILSCCFITSLSKVFFLKERTILNNLRH